MSDITQYEEFADRTEIDPNVLVSDPAAFKQDNYSVPDDRIKITITTVEYHTSEEDARDRLRAFSGEGHHWVTLTKGNKIIAEKSWSHFSDKHGYREVDGNKSRIRILVED